MAKSVNNTSDIGILFKPRSVAVIGAGNKPGNQGKMFLQALTNPKFKGELYAIHPHDKVEGYKSYPSVLDVPGPVDHVILSIPAEATIDVIGECGRKGVRSAALFTSGFAEEGHEQGRALQARLVAAVKKSEIRLIGPNCMGFYCPASGLSFRQDHPLREGPIGFVSQSGGICMTGIFIGETKRLGFSKAVSYGNESDLTSAELVQYLADDSETGVILVYIEGTMNGAALLKSLKYASGRKPVVMLKGGITGNGMKAVSSHTGAMAGSSEIWESASRQAGVQIVPSMDELFDAAQAFTRLRKPAGNRIGLITISGGFGVFATDILAKAGFELPQFGANTSETLTKLIKRPGTSISNPIDMASTFFQMKKYPAVFGALDADENVDMFVVLLAIEYLTYMDEEVQGWANVFISSLCNSFKLMKKPVSIVFFQTVLDTKRLELERMFYDAGFPVFPTVERCASALSRRMKSGK